MSGHSDSGQLPEYLKKNGGGIMPKNDRLFFLLNQLEQADLILLLKSGLRSEKVNLHRFSEDYLINMISKELRSAAGHSMANLFRDKHDFPYKRILIDVANQLTGKYFSKTGFRMNDNSSEEEIEKEIIRLFEKRAEKWWDSLKDSEKEKFILQVNQSADPALIGAVSKGKLSDRLTKEAMDSVIRNGLIRVVGGTFLISSIQWPIILNTIAQLTGMQLLFGAGGATLGMLGLTGVGLAAAVPGTILALTGSNHKKTVPTIIMLLSKIHLKSAV